MLQIIPASAEKHFDARHLCAGRLELQQMPGPEQGIKIFKEIHFLLQDFYLLRRKIRIGYQVGALGISEAQILFQTFAEPGINAKRLSEVLQLEKSTISRILNGVIKKGLVESKPSESDQREKLLFATESGAAFVGQLQASNDHILRECLKTLSAKEQYDLAYCLKLLADGLGCSEATYLPGDHPVTLEIVRLGRGTGMTGTSFMGTDYSSTHYHLLRALQLSPGQTLQELNEMIPLDASTLSRALRYLRQKNLIKPKTVLEKTRGMGFVLTKQGVTAVSTIDTKAGALIQKALTECDLSEVGRLHFLLEKVATGSENATSAVLQERVEVRELKSLTERQIARGLLLDLLVRNNRHFEAPDEMFSPNNISFGLFVADNLVAACEIVRNKAELTVCNSVNVPQLKPELLDSFLASAKRLVEGSRLGPAS